MLCSLYLYHAMQLCIWFASNLIWCTVSLFLFGHTSRVQITSSTHFLIDYDSFMADQHFNVKDHLEKIQLSVILLSKINVISGFVGNSNTHKNYRLGAPRLLLDDHTFLKSLYIVSLVSLTFPSSCFQSLRWPKRYNNCGKEAIEQYR